MSHKKIFTEDQKKEIIRLYKEEKLSAKKIGEQFNTSAPTILKNLAEWNISPNSRVLDLKNQRFGKLTVIKRAPNREDKYSRWVCKCDCGNITEVRTDYLTNGHTTSCGCEKQKYFKKLNLVGQKFGRLTVLESIPPDKQKCQCDCGNIITVVTGNLTSGNTQSCGCLQKDKTSENSFVSLVGQKFGKLTVLERVENNRYGHTCYKCRCDCGGVTIVDANNLRRGNTISCGCIKSKGEALINLWLQKHNINFIAQYSHPDIILESGRRPFFDFAIFDNNNQLLCLIEYDGKQHFEYSDQGWDNEENFIKTQNRDKQKNEQCQKLNIKLYRISYKDELIKSLENIMKDIGLFVDMEEAQEVIE